MHIKTQSAQATRQRRRHRPPRVGHTPADGSVSPLSASPPLRPFASSLLSPAYALSAQLTRRKGASLGSIPPQSPSLIAACRRWPDPLPTRPRRRMRATCLLVLALGVAAVCADAGASKPNVVIINADDLGFGERDGPLTVTVAGIPDCFALWSSFVDLPHPQQPASGLLDRTCASTHSASVTLMPGDIAAWGHPTSYTPNLDAMARRGSRLVQYYSAANICSPSRGSLLTGRLFRRQVYTA